MKPFKNFGENFTQFLTEVLELTLATSTDICIVVGLIAAILYIFGHKKSKNVPLLAWIINILIKIIGTVILGV